MAMGPLFIIYAPVEKQADAAGLVEAHGACGKGRARDDFGTATEGFHFVARRRVDSAELRNEFRLVAFGAAEDRHGATAFIVQMALVGV